MHSHPNARLTQRGRLRLVIQYLEEGRSLSELAAENGISLRCAYRWLARYRAGGVASLADRRSVRRTQRRTLDPQQLQHAVELRRQRLHLRHIARLLRAPFSTVARALSRLGLGRLRNLDPKPPVQRYEWARPGDLIHIDIKSLARFRKVGHRITGDRQQGRSTGVGYDKVHVAVDDATRLAYVEVLTDEQKPTVVGFLSRAIAWFNGQGIVAAELLRVVRPRGEVIVAFSNRMFFQKAPQIWTDGGDRDHLAYVAQVLMAQGWGRPELVAEETAAPGALGWLGRKGDPFLAVIAAKQIAS